MIPNETIDKILDKVDIVEVISGYIPLKKAGQNFKGLCPFHKEKTPSFMVSSAKQIFHCFGCGSGGNAVGFLMKYENMDFIEALKVLADKTGIPLPKAAGQDTERNSFADKLYDLNELACRFYQENLKKESGKIAHDYLARRGIDENTIRHFRLGFALDSWQDLINYCKSKGIEPDALEKVGLTVENTETKSRYDRFRNRIIFPIFDLRNRIIGFGARVLGDGLPKYINSPETHIYKKGKNLYGFNFSKAYIKRQDYVIIVEGYFDFIVPFQFEIRNVVATLGTALTIEHIDALRRFTKNVIMVYDPDKAGEQATLRGLDLLIEENMNARIAILPRGTDPDSFVRKEEKSGFMKILKESKDIFDYKLGILTARFKKDEPRGKTRIVEEMLPTLARIKNAVLQSSYLKRMSEKLSIDEEAIRLELKKVKPERTLPFSLPVNEIKKEPRNLAEMTVLSIVLEDTKFLERIKTDLGFRNFKDNLITAILDKMHDLHKTGKKITPSHLIGYFGDEKIKEIISEVATMGHEVKDKNKVLDDCIKHLKKADLKETLNNIRFEIMEAESVSDTGRLNKLIAEYNILIKGLSK